MATRASKVDRLIGVRIPNTDTPAVGYKVYVYNSGALTVPPNTITGVWTDADKSSPAARPIVLDAYGDAEVYAQGDLRFKIFPAADADDSGTPIYDWDQLEFEASRTIIANVASASYTIDANDHEDVIVCDTSGNAIEIILPAEANFKKPITIYNVGSASRDVTIKDDGGSTVRTLADSGATMLVVSGSAWVGLLGTSVGHSDQDFLWREGGANSRMDSGAALELGAATQRILNNPDSILDLIIGANDGWLQIETKSGIALAYNAQLSATAATGWAQDSLDVNPVVIVIGGNGLQHYEATKPGAGSDIVSWDIANGARYLNAKGGAYARMADGAHLELGDANKYLYSNGNQFALRSAVDDIGSEPYGNSVMAGGLFLDSGVWKHWGAFQGVLMFTDRVNGDVKVRVTNTSSPTFGTTATWPSTDSVWTSGNDGAGSGLDADLLDGQEGSYYAAAGAFFGSTFSRSFGTVYQAATDGFVIATTVSTSSPTNLTGKNGPSNPPTTIHGYAYSANNTEPASFCMPVKKGDYYEVDVTGIGSNSLAFRPMDQTG